MDSRGARDHRRRLTLEPLESRDLLSVGADALKWFTVTDGGDGPSDPAKNKWTLRGAVSQVGGLDGYNAIKFAVSTVTITQGSLPPFASPVTIDGGAGGVTINGSGAAAGANGLFLSEQADGSTIVNVGIFGFPGTQITVRSDGNTIQNSYIGTSFGGIASPSRPGGYGLTLTGSNNQVAGNVVSGNGKYGLLLAGTANTTVQGNFIGTDKSGNKPIGNGYSGVLVYGGAHDNLITGNVVSANKYHGVDLGGGGTFGAGATKNLLTGNFIGANKQGKDTSGGKLGNARGGVAIWGGASHNVVGGELGSAKSNVISNNGEAGVAIFNNDSNKTTFNRVEGNYIGTELGGSKPLPNKGNGVAIKKGASKNSIGQPPGTPSGNYGNVVSANDENGVYIGPGDATSSPANENTVQANYIGTNPAGDSLGNGANGVAIIGSQNVIGAPVGSSDTSLGNWIAYNGQKDESHGNGVVVAGTNSNRNTIRLNHIFQNKRLGIDLGDDYFDRYSLDTLGTEPNNKQWHPTIIGVNGGDGTIQWMLNAPSDPAYAPYTIDIYADPGNGRTEYAQGRDWVATLTTGAPAHGHFEFTTAVGVTKITATATDRNGNTSEFSLADEDGDGLCDTWEANGFIDLQGDGGHDADLPDAHLLKKDLYVEVDSMAGWAPVAGALESVQAVFAAHNITLHLPTAGRDNAIAPAAFGGPGVSSWITFHGIKQQFFANHNVGSDAYVAKLLAYRYVVFGLTYVEAPGSSGLAEIVGNDFMVTLGNSGFFLGRTAAQADAAPAGAHAGHNYVREVQAGTFLHEFGHTLGLSHRGPENWDAWLNWVAALKPGAPAEHAASYHSVMNYRYQGGGIGFWTNPAPPATPQWISNNQVLNYSTAAPDEWANLWFAFQENPQSLSGGDITSAPVDETASLPALDPSVDDLAALASPPESPVGVGTATPITFSVTNLGPATAVASTFTLTVPDGLVIGSVTASKGTTDVSGNTITALFGDLASLADATLSVVFTPTQAGNFTLTGQAASATTDGVPENNVATAIIVAESLDATVAGPGAAARGQTLIYTDPDDHASFTRTWRVLNAKGKSVASGSGLNFAFTPTATGTYQVRLSVSAPGGATATGQSTLVVAPAALGPDPADPGKTALYVGGTNGNDKIFVNPGAAPGDVMVTIGTWKQTFHPDGRLIVYGLGGNDTIRVAGTVGLDAVLYGGNGNDLLYAGGGNSVLAGGAGNDALYGAAARNVLLGGGGVDRLYGGNGDNVLVGSATAHDSSDRALLALLAEWSLPNSATSSFSTRISNLRSGAGDAAGFKLAADTIFDDRLQDTLSGGTGRNWFLNLSSAKKDMVKNFHAELDYVN